MPRSLLEFSDDQVKLLRERAAKVRQLWLLRPSLDVEVAAARELITFQDLRGISVKEFLAEVLDPGSFSNR